MTQKERSLITLKAIVQDAARAVPGIKEPTISVDFLIEKIDACLDLIRPEVLLDADSKKVYESEVEKLRRKGKII